MITRQFQSEVQTAFLFDLEAEPTTSLRGTCHFIVTMCYCHNVPSSHCFIVTPYHCQSVSVSQCFIVTMLHCHNVSCHKSNVSLPQRFMQAVTIDKYTKSEFFQIQCNHARLTIKDFSGNFSKPNKWLWRKGKSWKWTDGGKGRYQLKAIPPHADIPAPNQ